MKKSVFEPRQQNTVKLKDAAKAHFEQSQMDPQQLQRLSAYLKPETQATDQAPNWKSSLKWLGMLASALLLVMAWVFMPQSPNFSEMIATEVAMNHLNMKPLEVKTNQVASLRQYFTELDFSITKTSRKIFDDKTMLGGRYCSIQGVTAAQIRYEMADSVQSATLYEVGYNPDVHGEQPDIDVGESPKRLTINGVDVEIWVEKGLLMAQAKSAI
ncbi:hypothetical protein [Shewanella gelidii]|uniref:DUF3379 domain-containing protein n=1 Tax=Shewanella gelidii TaxID=1642821 RepID=A0A917JY00_9GAMM|nr:hypothetical protein [Shewanella gelidii]MCL1098880.1 hypothetical protein [Shewanella gelidii]GGI89670.1 hypothetical protein GCM10009332_28770 [Shewanella gelidii]